MKTFDVDLYNSLPLFSDAVRSSADRPGALMTVGEALVETGLHERFGIILLHRHFRLRSFEVPVRLNGRFASFSFMRRGDALVGEPIAWMFSPSTDTWRAIEFANTLGAVPRVDNQALSRLQAVIGDVLEIQGLAETYGLVDLAGISVHGRSMNYELSHDGLRLSMLSPWRDSAHRQLAFSQSIWSFVRHRDRIAVDDAAKCENCASCDRIAVDDAAKCENCANCEPKPPGGIVRYQRDENVFELGVHHSYLEEASDAVTIELLSRLDQA